jgi:hypothetical protein
MNTSQLLKVATKVFVSQDQEAKQEANRKMKRKVDLLAVALAEQPCRPWQRKRQSPWTVVSAPRTALP